VGFELTILVAIGSDCTDTFFVVVNSITYDQDHDGPWYILVPILVQTYRSLITPLIKYGKYWYQEETYKKKPQYDNLFDLY